MFAAAKLLQSCLTLCNPIDGSPPGCPVSGILQARTLEWTAISFSNSWKWKVKVKSLSRVGYKSLKHREYALHVAKLISDQWKTSSCLAMSINVYNIEDDRTFIIYWLIIYLEFPTYLNTFYVFSNFTPKYYVEDTIVRFHRRGNWGIKN